MAAYFSYRGDQVDLDDLLVVRDLMASRGPDGSGEWVSEDGSVALAHRRLAIIGLGDQGLQPMGLTTGCAGRTAELAISFNGEIYNFRELRRDLENKGHRFRTDTDTEVLLHLYEEHGDRFVELLRGMFALALWDAKRRALLLARDPNGIKPLYYADDGATIRAASQVKALSASRHIGGGHDDAAVAGFLLLGSVPEPRTFLQSVSAVPAGSVIAVSSNGRRTLRQFADVAAVVSGRLERHEANAHDISTAARESVKAHLVSDVPVGVFLSAGIDSGAILGLAAETHPAMRAVTLGFAEFAGTQDDEVELARQTARLYGARHDVQYVSCDDLIRGTERLFAAMDQPTVDGVNTWLVSEAAAAAGLKVVLSGIGADEALGGYATFASVPRLARRVGRVARVPGIGRTSEKLLRRLLPTRVSPKAASVLRFGGSIEGAWFLRRGLFMPYEVPAILGRDRAAAALTELDLTDQLHVINVNGGSDTEQVAALESALYLRNQLLRDTDWTSMAHSLEVRTPFVDARFQAALAGHPRNLDVPKLPLALAPQPPLPDSLNTRPKSGFTVPFARWLDRIPQALETRARMRDVLTGTHWSRLWAVTVASEFGLLDS